MTIYCYWHCAVCSMMSKISKTHIYILFNTRHRLIALKKKKKKKRSKNKVAKNATQFWMTEAVCGLSWRL